MFTEYKRFSLPLAGKTVKKEINFIIAGQGTVKMTIEVENGRMIDLTLHNTLHTPDFHSNLISILKICNLGLQVYFETDDIVAKFDNGRVAIQGVQ